MSDLWKTIGNIVAVMPADRIISIADAIRELQSFTDFGKAQHAFGPSFDPAITKELKKCWEQAGDISPAEVSGAFRGAACLAEATRGKESVDLVWTGPKTDVVPTRNTEQVILEVIDSALNEIFVVSYVFYDASSIVYSLNNSIARNISVNILLETSRDHGGTVKGDSVKTMRESVPGANIYVWSQHAKNPNRGARTGAVHAKCAVADGSLAFVTSANLTSAAMERNMELGVIYRLNHEVHD